jgi:putative Mg2+ transporter-C (MgtC) family protein
MLSNWVILFRLVLAAVLSGAIGFEREFHGRAAGFRTHILLCVGSTLVMLTSIHIFDIYNSRVPCDPARIAAGVVTGIGFLGAGTIMRSRASVRGLTTSASLWVAAGIGLAVGSGLYFGAIVTSILAMITLMIFARLEYGMIRKYWYKTVIVEMEDGVDKLGRIREVLDEHGAEVTDFEVGSSQEGANKVVKLGIKLVSTKYNDQLIQEINRLAGIKNVRWLVE